MSDWTDDPWISFASHLEVEFCNKHRETMPGSPYDVWDENELLYFFLVYSFWSAKSKFELRQSRLSFTARCASYRANLEMSFQDMNRILPGECDKPDFKTYLSRESEYLPLLIKGSSNFFRALNRSIFSPVCEAFIKHTCKIYIYSLSDLVKIISPWLIEKGIEFDKKVAVE